MRILFVDSACIALLTFASLPLAVSPVAAESVSHLSQGWSPELREQFYFTPQGSHMMRADWFAALEQPEGAGRFGDPAYLARFGFIPPEAQFELNPQGYPIGFAVEAEKNQIGLTCAACHTANIEVGGETLRVDGAPAQLDFDSFYQALATAVSRTRLDPARFGRFAAALAVTEGEALTRLQAELTRLDMQLTADAVLRKPALKSGFGRVDAMTQIVNSLAVRDQQRPENMYPVAAPTSYPSLWLTPHLEFVQWNGVAASPIARNSGQVLGVFGRADISDDAGADAFSSTILVNELAKIENWLEILEPPKWDEGRMGPIDRALAAEGEALFRETCSGCHNMAPYAQTDPAENAFGQTFIRIGRVDFRTVGTDPAYVQNLLGRAIATNATTAALFDGAEMVPAMRFFAGIVEASVRRSIGEAGFTQQEAVALSGYRFRPGADGKPVPYRATSMTDLKASPLAGAWATGPYLHNGSVPTIYELLSPVEERRAEFWTGGRSLDLRRLGFESEDAPGLFRFDTHLRGNGNGGHLFPSAGLLPDQRLAIIEYLKTQ